LPERLPDFDLVKVSLCSDGGYGQKGGKKMKRVILAIVAVIVAWSVIDFVIHGMILRSSYAATAAASQ